MSRDRCLILFEIWPRQSIENSREKNPANKMRSESSFLSFMNTRVAMYCRISRENFLSKSSINGNDRDRSI
jgi:hypothetical protein